MGLRSNVLSLVVLSAVSIAAAVSCFAVDAGPQLQTTPDRILGVVLYPDGVTPVGDLPIRIWSVARNKMIYRTATAADGSFSIPALEDGDCYVFVGRLRIDMKVLKARADALWQANDMVIVLPRGLIVSSSVTPKLFDVMLVPLVVRPPQSPKVVSP